MLLNIRNLLQMFGNMINVTLYSFRAKLEKAISGNAGYINYTEIALRVAFIVNSL